MKPNQCFKRKNDVEMRGKKPALSVSSVPLQSISAIKSHFYTQTPTFTHLWSTTDISSLAHKLNSEKSTPKPRNTSKSKDKASIYLFIAVPS